MRIMIKTQEEFRDEHVTIEIVADDRDEVADISRKLFDPDKAAEALAENYARSRNRVVELEAELEKVTDALILARKSRDENYNRLQVVERRATEWQMNVDSLQRQLAEMRERAEKAESRAHAFDLDRRSGERRIQELMAELARVRKQHVCTERCRPNDHVPFEGREMVTKLKANLAVETKRADQNKGWAERAEVIANQRLEAMILVGNNRDEAVAVLKRTAAEARTPEVAKAISRAITEQSKVLAQAMRTIIAQTAPWAPSDQPSEPTSQA